MTFINPIQLEVYKNRLSAIAEEMGVALCRSSYSSNIKERKDFSCALFDRQGQVIAQAEHLPVHLGSMPLSVQQALKDIVFNPGDSVIVNDPFAGGTHLPDITMISPVYIEDSSQPHFFVANRAHHSDVGGMTPGSMPLSTDIFQEGLRIPPLKWIQQGKRDENVLKLILNNVRTPIEREGDLMAQFSANQRGIDRLASFCQLKGLKEVLFYTEALKDYSEKMMRQAIGKIPDGSYQFEDYLDHDGITEQPLLLKVQLIVDEESLIVDFTGSASQTSGCVNTIYAVTLSSVFYAIRCLMDPDVPSNSGCLRPVKVIAPEQSIVNAVFPSAVVGGNVETSQRIVDVIFGALAKALPEQIPAASCGSMNNITIGGMSPETQQPFTYYETIGGGMGARPDQRGIDGVHTHMTNTLNTPIEALELTYPFRVHRYTLREKSGGQGLFRGGEGIIRDIELLTEAQVTLLTERRVMAPYGLQGGQSGAKGNNTLIRDGEELSLKGKCSFIAHKGDRVVLETPGGGGYGKQA